MKYYTIGKEWISGEITAKMFEKEIINARQLCGMVPWEYSKCDNFAGGTLQIAKA